VPTIVLDVRYAKSDNFIGIPIDGYLKPVAITTKEAAIALNNAQTDLRRFGLSLKVFDAYRPQRANRMLLQTVMEKQGFKPYPKEWWHFTLKQEPYPDTYFNFNVECVLKSV